MARRAAGAEPPSLREAGIPVTSSFDLDPVDRITAGAVGEPGERVFYIQARAGGRLLTLLAEKEQVQVLAATLDRLVESLTERPDAPEPPDEALELEEPLVPEWRAGAISLEYDEDADRIAVVVEEALPEESDQEPSRVRLVATREQLRAMARRALEICAAGRPRCQLCGFPIDPEGHTCPALNGHRRIQD